MIEEYLSILELHFILITANMADNTKITIITVTYNAEKILEETILSVLGQTYNSIEYIIIDGGSTDNTINTIKKYSNQITYWISEPDKGIYDAMNKGISIATGEYILFLNSGDSLYSPQTIDLCINYVQKHIETDILYGNTILLFKSKKFLSTPENISELHSHMPFCHQSCLTRSSILKKYKFNVDYKILADFDFFRNLYTKNYIFSYCNIIIANYEAETGISSIPTKKLMLEYAKIKCKNNKTKYLFLHFIIFSKFLFKQLIPQKFFIKKIERNFLAKYPIYTED